MVVAMAVALQAVHHSQEAEVVLSRSEPPLAVVQKVVAAAYHRPAACVWQATRQGMTNQLASLRPLLANQAWLR